MPFIVHHKLDMEVHCKFVFLWNPSKDSFVGVMFIWSLESSKYDISTCHHVNSNEACDEVEYEKVKSVLSVLLKKTFSMIQS